MVVSDGILLRRPFSNFHGPLKIVNFIFLVPGFVIIGLIVVGVTDALYQSAGEAKGRNSLITGDLLIIVAQVISACQMVYEEKYVAGKC